MMFSYIYYRINKAYFRWDGRRGATALIGLSMVQILWVFDLLLLLAKIYVDRSFIAAHRETIKLIVACIIILVAILNYRIHSNNYNLYKKRWANETLFQKRYRGILVILAIVIPIVLMPVIINSKIY